MTTYTITLRTSSAFHAALVGSGCSTSPTDLIFDGEDFRQFGSADPLHYTDEDEARAALLHLSADDDYAPGLELVLTRTDEDLETGEFDDTEIAGFQVS